MKIRMLILMLFVTCRLCGMEKKGEPQVEVIGQIQATPENLDKAVFAGNLETVQRILEADQQLANAVFAELPIFHTAIRQACGNKGDQNRCKIVEKFLAAGAAVDTKDKDGNTSLNIAINGNDDGQIIGMLLNKSAAIDDFDPSAKNRSPLQSAVWLRKDKIVEHLLQATNSTIQFATLITAANRVVNFDNPDNLRISREIFNLIWRYYLGPNKIEKFKKDLTKFVSETADENVFQKNTELLLKAGVWIITLIRYCGFEKTTREKNWLRLRLLNAYRIYRYGQVASGAHTSINAFGQARTWISERMSRFLEWLEKAVEKKDGDTDIPTIGE